MVNAQLGSGQSVIVTYSAPAAILSSSKWQQLKTSLTAQFPLRNIHWKAASRSSLRTIQELDVNFLHLETIRDAHSQVPMTLLEKPLLNIYVVTCQNTDLDGYRTSVKKQIKDWHVAATSRKNQEWLILHVLKPDAKAPSANFFQLKGSVFEKIRADFNAEKRERCVQVTWSAETETPTVWAELINKIKDGVLSAYDSAVTLREEEVKRSESQRQMPGWNFCTFFILKESLASSFEGVNLPEDAYSQYEELETTFQEVLKEKNLSWFGNLINYTEGDDSAPLLSVSRKAYRDLILANTISVFDFRIYLLSRQCELLAKMGRLNEVCKKSASFLSAFSRRLRDVEITLPRFFIESWIYSSALSVVDQCDLWASQSPVPEANVPVFNATKGELLELAKNELDAIGVTVGHLPQKPPFPATTPKSPPVVSLPVGITNTKLVSAIESADAFYETYIATTNRSIDMYTKAGWRKFALKLHGSLAALDLHRGNLATALSTYTSLPSHYAPHMWTSLESFMLSRALDTHADLGKKKDVGWIHILLSYLKTYVDASESELLLHEEDRVAYITSLVDGLKLATSSLDADLLHSDHPCISVSVPSNVRLAETQDGYLLDITARNHLPCPLPVDEFAIYLAGRDGEKYRFSSKVNSLPTGKSSLTLFCPTCAAGTYVFDSSEARLSRLLLQWNHRKDSASRSSRRKCTPVLVRLPQDLLALGVSLALPDRIELGETPALLVTVSTGRNRVSKVGIRLSSSSVAFRPQQAFLAEGQEGSLEIVNHNITLSDVDEGRKVSIMVPHSDSSALHAMKILAEVEYITVAEPDILRAMKFTRAVLTSLPISVNVEDFFRGPRLISKFTISSTTHQHVRIAETCLETPKAGLEGVTIIPTSTKNRDVITVTPAQPAHFLFCVNSKNGPVREALTLSVKYRMLREEVEAVVEKVVDTVLASSPSSSLQDRVEQVNSLVEGLEHDANWVDLYGITGELNVPCTPREGRGEVCDLYREAKKLLSQHRHPSPPEGKWRVIKIPVDVPFMNIAASARIRIFSTPFASVTNSKSIPLFAGQPISAELSIYTSFHWGSGANDKDLQYRMRYDVEEMVKDWLVSGQKRGDFTAKDDATYTMPITLIALHHGELSLPKVSVTALPVAGEMTMGSLAIPSAETYQVHGAERVLVLPRGGRSTFVIGMGSRDS